MTNPSYTHLALIIDRSGSMGHIAKDMEGGIKQLLEDQAKEPGECHVDITTFDTVVETPYVNVRPDDVKDQIIRPRGRTALLDALGATITRLSETFAKLDEADRPEHVVVIVVTDGMENASEDWTCEQVAGLVKQQTSDYGWVFQFLGANIDSFTVAGDLGFAKAQTMDYGYTSTGSKGAMAAASSSITRTRSGLATDFTDDERKAAGL